ncbi:MAG: TIM barrel protein [Treponema sp.]|nr:TIM barrel protein [Treponema sp.]
MKYSICIDSVFSGLDSLKALEQVKACGFTTYEFWSWWNRDLDALKKKADALGMNCSCCCTKFFTLTEPSKRSVYLQDLKESIKAAKKIGAPCLISQGGDDSGAVHTYQRRSVVEGLREAAPIVEDAGITLLLEPLNGKIDHKGTWLESSDEAFEIVREVGSGNVKLLFDIYHQQISEGDVIRRLTSYTSEIRHVHSAGNPGRHELDSGELDYPRIFKALEEAGYQGYLGLEYVPAEDPVASLKRMRTLLS